MGCSQHMANKGRVVGSCSSVVDIDKLAVVEEAGEGVSDGNSHVRAQRMYCSALIELQSLHYRMPSDQRPCYHSFDHLLPVHDRLQYQHLLHEGLVLEMMVVVLMTKLSSSEEHLALNLGHDLLTLYPLVHDVYFCFWIAGVEILTDFLQ